MDLVDLGRRTLAVADRVIPFTLTSYDDAFRDRLPAGGLPNVTVSRAMGLPAAYACTVAISEDIAKIPLQIFELDGDERRLARQHPIYDLLHDQFNDEMSAIEGREWMVAVALNRGEAIAEIKAGRRGRVDQLVPLHPDRIRWEDVPRGGRRVTYQDPATGKSRTLMRDELFVLRGRFGVGVVTVMRQAFASMLSMQQYQAEMYGRGVRSPGSLTHPGKLADPARHRLRKALDEYMGGGERAGRPLLLEEGMEWKTIALSMEDAQYLETLQDGYGQVCMAYRVPQHKIQMLMRATNNNIEQQSVDWVTDGLVGWAVRMEQAVRRDLITSPRFMAHHNLDALARGDLKTRYEAYAIAITVGWITRAEVRQKEDMNPLDEEWRLDEPLVPLNMGGSGNVPGTGVALDIGGTRYGAVVPRPSSQAVSSYLKTLVRDGAGRVVRAETAELRKLAKKGGWEQAVGEFYGAHAETVARVLRIPAETAQAYCAERQALLAAGGPASLDDDMDHMQAVTALTRVALRQADIFQDPDIELGAVA